MPYLSSFLCKYLENVQLLIKIGKILPNFLHFAAIVVYFSYFSTTDGAWGIPISFNPRRHFF